MAMPNMTQDTAIGHQSAKMARLPPKQTGVPLNTKHNRTTLKQQGGTSPAEERQGCWVDRFATLVSNAR